MTHKKLKTSLWGLFLILLCTQCALDTTEEILTDFKQAEKESRVADIEFPEKVDTFFINQVQDSTLLKLIHRFKSNLTDSAKIETLNQYVQSYGYPLWEQFFYTRLDEGFLYAVPVAKDGDKIETIWFFKVTGKRLHSFSTNRKTLSSFDWMYDYFTSRLYFKPNSQKTKVKRGPQSRALQCNDIYTGYVDEYGNEHLEYSYTYCWDDGFGGGSDYVYEDDNEGGEGGNGDIDYEVAPPPDEGGGSTQQNQHPISSSVILNNVLVKAQATKALTMMKNDLEEGRREYAFWIFYDKNTKTIYIGNLQSGVFAKGTERVYINKPSSAPADNPGVPVSATPVALYHVHTAMSNVEEGWKRSVGLSSEDSLFAKDNNKIIIAEDYIGEYDAKLKRNVIKSGHSKNDSTKTYVYQP